jgi:hypothetical protein
MMVHTGHGFHWLPLLGLGYHLHEVAEDDPASFHLDQDESMLCEQHDISLHSA